MEHEFKSEYQVFIFLFLRVVSSIPREKFDFIYFFLKELRKQCQDFATALLDHTRSSYELEIMLNHDPKGPAFEHGDRMSLNRLKLAIKYRQKKVLHTAYPHKNT